MRIVYSKGSQNIISLETLKREQKFTKNNGLKVRFFTEIIGNV